MAVAGLETGNEKAKVVGLVQLGVAVAAGEKVGGCWRLAGEAARCGLHEVAAE